MEADRKNSIAEEVLDFFLTREPCRVVVVKPDRAQLGVFWDELIGIVLKGQDPENGPPGQDPENGPPTLDIKEWTISKRFSPVSYIKVCCSSKGEGLMGHHVQRVEDGRPSTMAVCSDPALFERLHTWAHVILDESEPDCDTPTLLKRAE